MYQPTGPGQPPRGTRGLPLHINQNIPPEQQGQLDMQRVLEILEYLNRVITPDKASFLGPMLNGGMVQPYYEPPMINVPEVPMLPIPERPIFAVPQTPQMPVRDVAVQPVADLNQIPVADVQPTIPLASPTANVQPYGGFGGRPQRGIFDRLAARIGY